MGLRHYTSDPTRLQWEEGRKIGSGQWQTITMAIVTLTTDFGWTDYYVGTVKGIIYQIAPETTVVDITHDIPAQGIVPAALVLREIWRTFPKGTIHVAIVDPGVGTDRKIILAQYAEQLFLVPDNGLISLIHRTCRADQVNVVTNDSLFCQPVSPTFHGRDIFAPVAAHLAKGVNPDRVGPRTDFVSLFEITTPKMTVDALTGQVIHVDHFGNLVTNISTEELARFAAMGKSGLVHVAGKPVGSIRRTFADVAAGQTVAYVGSARMLEIAVNQRRAETELDAGIGTAVELT